MKRNDPLPTPLRIKRESLKNVDKRWTQEFTADFLGVSKRAYCGWEAGETEQNKLGAAAVHKFLSTSNRKLKKEANRG